MPPSSLFQTAREHVAALFAENDVAQANDPPEGVKFGLKARVEIRFGQRRGARGAVVGLLGLEPRPRYLVELPSGEAVEVGEYSLQSAG